MTLVSHPELSISRWSALLTFRGDPQDDDHVDARDTHPNAQKDADVERSYEADVDVWCCRVQLRRQMRVAWGLQMSVADGDVDNSDDEKLRQILSLKLLEQLGLASVEWRIRSSRVKGPLSVRTGQATNGSTPFSDQGHLHIRRCCINSATMMIMGFQATADGITEGDERLIGNHRWWWWWREIRLWASTIIIRTVTVIIRVWRLQYLS